MEMQTPTNEETQLIKNEELEDKRQCSRCCEFPLSVYFIVVTEFCERFCYYGMRAVLVLYLTRYIGLTSANAMGLYHFWVVATYVTPLLGGYIADNHIGKFYTILSLSIVYGVGTVVMAATAAAPPNLAGPLIGLLLIALGSGGIKSSTSSLGGDQIPAEKTQLLDSFFSVFYFTINAGAVLSSFFTPLLRARVHCNGQDTCYPLAFGISSVLMAVAIIVFGAGKRMYIDRPAKDNAVGKFFGCSWYAFKKYVGRDRSAPPKSSWLDYAGDRYSEETIMDVKKVNGIVVLFLPMTIFWSLYDQQSSRWTLQASHLDGYIGHGWTLLPDQMTFVNALLILLFIPLFESVVYPLVVKCGIADKPLRRMTAGLLITVASFLVAFFLQLEIERFHVYPPAAGQARVRLVSAEPACNLSAPAWAVATPGPFQASAGHVLASDTGAARLTLTCANGSALSASAPLSLRAREDFLLFGWREGGRLRTRQQDSRLKKDRNGLALVRAAFVAGRLPFQRLELRSGPAAAPLQMAVNGSGGGLVTSAWVKAARRTYRVRLVDADRKSVDLGSALLLSGEIVTLMPHRDGERWSFGSVVEVPGNNISILWQLPQYVMMTAAEILVSITGLAFSYAEAPVSMKASVSSVWLLYTGLGNLIVAIVSELNLMPRDSWNYILFSGLCLLTTFIFVLLAYFYKRPESNESMKLKSSNNEFADVQASKAD